MADPVAISPAVREKMLISRGNVPYQSRIALVNHGFGIDLTAPVGSGILTVGSGLAGEFGTAACLSISHHSRNNQPKPWRSSLAEITKCAVIRCPTGNEGEAGFL
jgi:hypothetical protein